MDKLQIIEDKLDKAYQDIEKNTYSYEGESIILNNILKLSYLKSNLLKQEKQSTEVIDAAQASEISSNLKKLIHFLNVELECSLVKSNGKYYLTMKNLESDSTFPMRFTIPHICISQVWFDFLSNYLRVENH